MIKEHNKPLIVFLFILSGIVSLIYQVVWLKMLTLVFGNTVWAVSTLLTVFMAGLALGSWIFGRVADLSASPLRIYGFIEGIIGIFGLLTPLLFKHVVILYRPLYLLSGGDNFLLGLFKFVLGFLILIIPTFLMGGTLPLLAKHFSKSFRRASKDIGFLYTVNTLGAVIGVFISGFFMIPFLGLRLSIVAAATLNFLILLVIIPMTSGEKSKVNIAKIVIRKSDRIKTEAILWIFFGCGFAALAYEVLWNRILVLTVGTNVYAYSVILVVYLLGVTLGSAVMSSMADKLKQPGLWLGLVQITIGLYIVVQIKLFGLMPDLIFSIRSVLTGASYSYYIFTMIFALFLILFLPTFLFGASFPLAVRLFLKSEKNLGRETGILYSFNTMGTILGSFAAGFVILPLIGAQRGIILMALLNLGLGIYLLMRVKGKVLSKAGIAAVTVLLFIAGNLFLLQKDEVILKGSVFQSTKSKKKKIINYSEDIYATVTVEDIEEGQGNWRRLSLNGVDVAGTSSELFTIQKLQGHLPLLLHGSARSVLHIGFGSGGTAWSVSCHPVKNITIAEISQSIIDKSSQYFHHVNHNVLQDPRLKIHITDGRNFVLASRETFDVILSDSIHPRYSGNGSLYTYDYYRLLKKRLNPGGVVSMWLPFYGLTVENFKMIVKSFYRVFPNTSIWFVNSTLNTYVIVVGKEGDEGINFSQIEKTLKISKVFDDLKEIGAETPFKILDYFMFANEAVAGFVGDVPLHTDNNMAVEYFSSRSLKDYIYTVANFNTLVKHRTSVWPLLVDVEQSAIPADEIKNHLSRYEKATYLNLMGQYYFQVKQRKLAFQLFERIRQINPEDLEPVEYFGSTYQKPFLKKADLDF